MLDGGALHVETAIPLKTKRKHAGAGECFREEVAKSSAECSLLIPHHIDKRLSVVCRFGNCEVSTLRTTLAATAIRDNSPPSRSMGTVPKRFAFTADTCE